MQIVTGFPGLENRSPRIAVLTSIPLGDPPAAIARARAFLDVGVTGLVPGARYQDAAAWKRDVDAS